MINDTLIFWFDKGNGKRMAHSLFSCKNRTAAARIENGKMLHSPSL
jgi:hypothetical protein